MKMGKGENLESLPNIGKVLAGTIRELGLETVSDFMKQDPYDVFEEIRKRIDPNSCRCALASIVGAHKGVKWYTITKETCKEYERRHPNTKWVNC